MAFGGGRLLRSDLEPVFACHLLVSDGHRDGDFWIGLTPRERFRADGIPRPLVVLGDRPAIDGVARTVVTAWSTPSSFSSAFAFQYSRYATRNE